MPVPSIAAVAISIDVEKVVSLTEPARLGLDHGEHRSHEVAPSFDVEERVAAAARARKRLPVVRVEIGSVLGERGKLSPIHLVIEVLHAPGSLVGKSDAAGFAEGHGPERVSRSSLRADPNHGRLHFGLETVSRSEKVAERHVDARAVAPVVVHAKAEKARPAVLARRDGEPDVTHDTGTLEIGEHRGLPGDRPLAVVVRGKVRVVGRAAVRGEVLGCEEPEGVIRLALSRKERQKGQHRFHGAKF